MIPIECPKCGRGGNVPPDRLNARLVCKKCHTVFHMDASGRMVLGEPYDPSKDPSKRVATAKPDIEFDFAQTLRDIPAPARYGVPGVLVVLIFWLYLLPMMSGPGAPAYQGRAEKVIRAMVAKDRARTISLATASSTDMAGKWYDVMSGLMDQNKIDTDCTVTVALYSGDPDRGDSITLWCIVFSNAAGVTSSVPVNIEMKRDGDWKLDGSRSLDEAQKTIAAAAKKK